MEMVKAGEKEKATEMENGKMDCLEAVTCQGNVSYFYTSFENIVKEHKIGYKVKKLAL